MLKRITSWLLVFVLLLGMVGNVAATGTDPSIIHTVMAQKQDRVTVQLAIPGGSGSGNGRIIYNFPEVLTLEGATSLVGSEGISDLTTSATAVSFAWANAEDYTQDTPILEMTFSGVAGLYSTSVTFPEKDNETVDFTIELTEPYRFKDVMDASQWYFSYVYAAYDASLIEGIGNDLFAPHQNLTRAQMATLLHRMAGSPEATGESDFSDVPADAWYAEAVLWAAQNQIVNGRGGGSFDPDGKITREEAVTMLVRYADQLKITLKQTQKPDPFTDEAKISAWAKRAVAVMTEAGILSGYPDSTFRPKNHITRAETAKIMVLFLEALTAAGEEDPQPTEPEPTEPEPTEPEPTEPEPTEPQESYTITFVSDRGYAKVDGQKVDSYTLEPGQTWLTFSLHGDKSIGYELDDVTVTGGTLSQNGSAFILKDIDRDITVSFTTQEMVLTVNFISTRTATIEPGNSVEVAWGEPVEEPVATANGYEVVGWYTEPTFEHLYDFSQPVYEDLNLYAKWGTKHYTVNFWDGEDLLYSQQVAHGSRIERPSDPQKEEFLFVGWYTNPELTEVFSFIKAITTDMDLYAMWRVDDRADYIYLGANDKPNLVAYGVCGDDANDGSSMEKAVKTFERAKELLKDSKNPVIILCGKMPIEEDTTWSMEGFENAKVVRNFGLTGYVIEVKEGVTLTLDNIVLDGGGEMFPGMHDGGSYAGLLYLQKGSSIVMNAGTTVQNCVNGSTCAAMYCNANCNVTINEGVTFQNNYSSYSGAFIAGAGCTVTINGGTFTGNRQTGTLASTHGCYGSVFSVGSSTAATLNLNGGTFTGNHASVGGTIGCLQTVNATINGGIITGNTSEGTSAGITVGFSSTSFTGSGTLTLNKALVKDNHGEMGADSPQVYALRGGQIILNGAKDAIEVGSFGVDDYNGAYGLYASKPLSNLKGGSAKVWYNDIDINTVLLRGYNTYKITEADAICYKLQNNLGSHLRTELDQENGIYRVYPQQNIGAAVYMNSPTVRTNPGNDENDGLTPETPVATFDRAKAILKTLAKDDGSENLIYVMGTIPVNAGETVTLTLGDIPNASLVRHENANSYLFNVGGGKLILEDITVDGNSLYTARTKTASALFYVCKGGDVTFKSSVVIRNVRSQTHSVLFLFATKDYTTTATVEDLTVVDAIKTYTTSSTTYYGSSIFYVGGQGTGTLNINGGTYTGNEARLLYVTGPGANTVNINDCVFTDNELAFAGAVFATYNTAASQAVINFNGGTFARNTATYKSTTRTGGIGYHQSTTTVNLNGGSFVDNTAAHGQTYDGFYLKPYNKSFNAEIYLNKLNQDTSIMLVGSSKTDNNAWAVITAPMTQKVTLYVQYQIQDFIVARGTDSYTLTEADLAKLVPGNEGVTFYLDTENNTICMNAPKA